MANSDNRMKQRILAAAEAIVRRDGAKRLTQPEVARRAQIRQSHLTYYFPRRTDLLAALAGVFLERTSRELTALENQDPAPDPLAVIALVERLMAPPDAMRAFIGLIVEADQDPALRSMLVPHLVEFNALIARHLGRSPSDPDVPLLLAAVRGFGLENLLTDRDNAGPSIQAAAARLGFLPARKVARPAGKSRETRTKISKKKRP